MAARSNAMLSNTDGPRALWTAVLHAAVEDAKQETRAGHEARRFLNGSPRLHEICSMLDINTEWFHRQLRKKYPQWFDAPVRVEPERVPMTQETSQPVTNPALYFGGMPTEPDIQKLIVGIVAKPGETIPHEAIEEILGVSWRSARYQTVTTAWRKRLLAEQNVDLCAVPRIGFLVLTERQRLEMSVRNFHMSARGIHRSVKRLTAVRVHELKEPDRQRYDHARRLMVTTLETVTTARKALIAPMTPLLPRPQMV